MRIEGIGLSDIGLRRACNEDFIFVDNELHLYIVCDGVGGGGNGDIASKMAAESVVSYIKNNDAAFQEFYKSGKISILEELLKLSIQEACHNVFSAAHKNPKLTGMASTLTALLFINDRAILGHVGDSRLYLARNNQVYIVTEDHTLGREARERYSMSEEDIKVNKLDHILNRSIGYFKSVEVDTLIFDILPGDELILCSDGLHNYLRNPVQLLPMLEHEEVNSSLKEMVEFAIKGGGSDNISVIIIQAKLEDSIYMGFNSGKNELLNDFSILDKIYLFKDLNFIRVNRLLNICETIELKAGETVKEQNEKVSGVYIVYNGEVETNAENKVSQTLSKGNIFGQLSLMMDYHVPFKVTAKTPCTLLYISSHHYKTLCRNHPKFGVKLLENFISGLKVENF